MIGLVHATPTGVGYSLLLLAHVAAAFGGFGALALTGAQANRARLGPSQPDADAVRRYFRPGVNWAGRLLYGVPVLGFALVADSNHAFTTSDFFVVAGLALWLAAALLAEMMVWPSERRIQQIVTDRWDDPGIRPELERRCRQAVGGAAASAVIFVVSVAVMIGKP